MRNSRILHHPVLGELETRKAIDFRFDQQIYQGFEGETIAAALLANGVRVLRCHEETGTPRGIYCNIGHCYECRVSVDSKSGIRACLTPIQEGMDVRSGQKLPGVEVQCGVSVYNIKHENGHWKVYTTKEMVKVKALLLATGAAETALPIPGWTLPGVMSIGAAQVMTNVHRVKVGQRGVIVGINILSVAIARELLLAGIEADSMLLPEKNPITDDSADPKKVMESLLRVSHLAPSKLIRYGSYFMKYKFMQKMGLQFYPKNGFSLWGMPIQLRKAALEIVGDKQVEGVRTVDIDPDGQPIYGSERVIDADFVCIAGGLYPLVELASVAGCPFRFIPELGGHVPVHNEKMKTPVKGLYVAGNITGIESAKVAMAQGEVAGFSILNDLFMNKQSFEDQLMKSIQDVKIQREEAIIQFHPNIHQGRRLVQSTFGEYHSELDSQVTHG